MSDRKKQLKDSADRLNKSVEEADRIDDYYARGRARKSKENEGAGITQRSMKKFSSAVHKNENFDGLNNTLEQEHSDKPITTRYLLIALFIIAAVFFAASLLLSASLTPA